MNQPQNPVKLMTAKEIAVRYALHPKTVWKYARIGLLPRIKLARRCVRFDIEVCDAALKRRMSGGFSTLFTHLFTLTTAILLAFLVAEMATICQHNCFSEVGQRIPKLKVVRSIRTGITLFSRAKSFVKRILGSLARAHAWESWGGVRCV